MTKYKEYFNKMLSENSDLFENFRKLHDEYGLNQEGLQNDFNKDGAKIIEIVHEYENRLCANTERGMYNKFSVGLAEKFQLEVRKYFPLIDHVGLIAEKFTLKKIKIV